MLLYRWEHWKRIDGMKNPAGEPSATHQLDRVSHRSAHPDLRQASKTRLGANDGLVGVKGRYEARGV